MNNKRYPASLFLMGFITNVLFRYGWLVLPGLILWAIGFYSVSCFYVGAALLLIDVVLSLVEQLRIRQAFLEESDDPDFQAFQNAMSKDGGWRGNINELLNQIMSDPQNETKSDEEDEDK